MFKVSIDDKKLKKLTEKLSKIPTKTGNVAQDELHKSGLLIETSAKNNVPVDTGRLRSSIHMESNKVNRSFIYSDKKGESFDGKLGVNPVKLEVYVGTNVEYASKISRLGGKGGKGRMFLFNASEQERPFLIARMQKKVRGIAGGK